MHSSSNTLYRHLLKGITSPHGFIGPVTWIFGPNLTTQSQNHCHPFWKFHDVFL